VAYWLATPSSPHSLSPNNLFYSQMFHSFFPDDVFDSFSFHSFYVFHSFLLSLNVIWSKKTSQGDNGLRIIFFSLCMKEFLFCEPIIDCPCIIFVSILTLLKDLMKPCKT